MQILGLLLLGSGVMAVAGSSRRSTSFMTASLTVSVVGILLAFEFIAEVPVLSPCCAICSTDRRKLIACCYCVAEALLVCTKEYSLPQPKHLVLVAVAVSLSQHACLTKGLEYPVAVVTR